MLGEMFSNRSRTAALAALSGLCLAAAAGCANTGGKRMAVTIGGGPATTPAMMTVDATPHRTSPFRGPKANTGYATHHTRVGKSILTLSDDFKIPDTPAPHWQLVDSRGNAYLLQRLKIKGDKYNQAIEVPAHVPDVAKVQIWCAWAETLLGEASFSAPVR